MLYLAKRVVLMSLLAFQLIGTTAYGANPNPIDLFAAVRAGDAATVSAAITAGIDINVRDNWGRTPLIISLQQSKMPVFEALLNGGAQVNLTDNWGRTPLLVAAQYKNTSAVRRLLQESADTNAANKNDITPLIATVQTGNRESVELLLAAGATLDRQDALGWTALMWAVDRNDAAMVKLLLARGADVSKTALDRSTALDVAKRCGADAALLSLLEARTMVAGTTGADNSVDCKTPSPKVSEKLVAKVNPTLDPARTSKGAVDAPITIVKYTDFQCPYCRYGAKTIEEVMARYEGQVRLVIKHFPLKIHPAAMPAALYFEAISLQNPIQAWQFYDKLFADPHQLSRGEEYLKIVSSELGVDMERLDQDARSAVVRSRIAADLKEVEEFRFDGVPVFVINGTVLMGAQPPQSFFEIIDAALRNTPRKTNY